MLHTLSIIVPCYNEEETIPSFFNETQKIVSDIPELEVDYLFINDGSTDKTLTILKQLSKEHPMVNYLSFSKNFGKEAALYAGLKNSSGDYVVVMDADLQDPPSFLKEMYRLLQTTEYDCIGTRRVSRKGEPRIRSFFAKKFYTLINKISDIEIVDGARDFRMMTRQMTDAILELQEYNRFSKGIFSWVGFDTMYLDYENVEREKGKTSWSFWGLFKYSLEGIISFSDVPLTFATFVGFFSFIVSIIALIFIVIRASIFGDPTSGWPSLVCIILALGGIQLFCLGIVGKYLGKTFLEVKKRPIYIMKETSIKEK